MTRQEAIREVARVLWLSTATGEHTKRTLIAETCDGRPWLGVDRWDYERFVRDVLRTEKEMRAV